MDGLVGANGRLKATTLIGSGPGLLAIHGWNASRRFFDQILPYLSGRFRIVAPDLVGFGDGPKPSRDLTMEALSTDALEIADRARLDRFSILGHSMGAAVAILLAARVPGRVERLVLSNGLIHGPTSLLGFHQAIATTSLRKAALVLRAVRTIRRWISPDFADIERLNPLAARDMLRGTYRNLGSTLDAILRTDLESVLKSLELPVALLWCEDDAQLSRDQFERQRRARPDAQVRILDVGGHCPMIERPREYAATLLELLTLDGPRSR